MSEILGSFDARDISVDFWLLVAAVAAATSKKVRVSMRGVLRAFFVRDIVQILLYLAAYLAGLILLLSQIGIWTLSHLKLTLVWFVTVGAVGLFAVPKISQDPDYFSQSVRSSVGITVLIEFFINLYRMPLLAELLFVPAIAFLGALFAVSETKAEFSQARSVLNGITILVGSLLLVYALWRTATDFGSVSHADTLRSFVLPIIFSLWLLPFLWLASVLLAYQEVFARLQFVAKNRALHSYIRRSLLLEFKGNIRILRAWFRAAWSRPLETKEDVDESIHALSGTASAV